MRWELSTFESLIPLEILTIAAFFSFWHESKNCKLLIVLVFSHYSKFFYRMTWKIRRFHYANRRLGDNILAKGSFFVVWPEISLWKRATPLSHSRKMSPLNQKYWNRPFAAPPKSLPRSHSLEVTTPKSQLGGHSPKFTTPRLLPCYHYTVTIPRWRSWRFLLFYVTNVLFLSQIWYRKTILMYIMT